MAGVSLNPGRAAAASLECRRARLAAPARRDDDSPVPARCIDAWRAMKLFRNPNRSILCRSPPRHRAKAKRSNQGKQICQRSIDSQYLHSRSQGILSIGSVVGLAQTNAPSDQTGKAAEPAAPGYGPMMGGWRGGMMGYGGMGPGMMYQGGMGPGMMGQGGFGPGMCAAMASHVDGRLAYLKAELKITDAQQPLWKAYAAASRDNAQGMQARCTAMMSSKGAGGIQPPRSPRPA